MRSLRGCAARPASAASTSSLAKRNGRIRRCASMAASSSVALTFSSHGPSLNRPTRLLRQAAAAATIAGGTTSTPPSSANTTAADPTAATPEMGFYDTFVMSDVDVHQLLLEEAHRKHGVWRNVPPQLAPTVPGVGPPVIPEPLYPPAQQSRLDALAAAAEAQRTPDRQRLSSEVAGVLPNEHCLAYPPTHQPPPFVTTGTRQLWVGVGTSSDTTAAASSTSEEGVTAVTTAGRTGEVVGVAASGGGDGVMAPQLQTTVTEVAIRAPVDATMRFHCSYCGRPFRRREAAAEHVEKRHDHTSSDAAEAAATVQDGPGPGEVIGFKNVVETSIVSPSPAAPTVTTIGGGTRATATTTTATTTNTKEEGDAASTTPVTSDGAESANGTLKETLAAENPSADSTSVSTDAATPSSDDKPVTSAAFTAAAKPSRLVGNYRSVPSVTAPEEDLVDSLLQSVWDDVGLQRTDIEKAAGVAKSTTRTTAGATATVVMGAVDSCNGRFFIPSTAFVHGTADNRSAVEAEMAGKPLARATPEGAAPGVRRPSPPTGALAAATSASTLGRSGGGLRGLATHRLFTQHRNPDGSIENTADADGSTATVAAPTAQEMSILELSRHYPNPFGDSPNAALVELEKEPVNPFRDIEAEVEKAAETVTAAVTPQEAIRSKWLTKLAARPYACPICQRHALPGFTTALAALWPISPLSTTAPPTAAASSASLSSAVEGAAPSNAGAAVAAAAASTTEAEQTKTKARPRSSSSKTNAPASSASSTSTGNTAGAAEKVAATACDTEGWTWYLQKVPRFRLLDALEDHLESSHDVNNNNNISNNDSSGDDVTAADWQRLYITAASPTQAAEAELTAVHQLYRAAIATTAPPTARETRHAKNRGVTLLHADAHGEEEVGEAAAAAPSSAAGEGAQDGSATVNDDDNGSGTNGNNNGADDEEASQATSAAAAPHVHVRAAVNTVLVGVVRDVQEGFVGATRILQYVVAVGNEDVKPAAEGSVEAEELIVVRCIGDLVPATLLRNQVHVGSTLFVTGTLRLNRNVDTTSRRSHAYPYVQVVPPLGFVRVVK